MDRERESENPWKIGNGKLTKVVQSFFSVNSIRWHFKGDKFAPLPIPQYRHVPVYISHERSYSTHGLKLVSDRCLWHSFQLHLRYYRNVCKHWPIAAYNAMKQMISSLLPYVRVWFTSIRNSCSDVIIDISVVFWADFHLHINRWSHRDFDSDLPINLTDLGFESH